MTPGQNPLFVKLSEPLSLKKSIIESAMNSVLLLKEHERLKLTEKQIEGLTSRFIAAIKNIEREIDVLNSLLPRVKTQGIQTNDSFDVAPIYNTQEEVEITEPSSLEDELRDIEEKLKSIAL